MLLTSSQAHSPLASHHKFVEPTQKKIKAELSTFMLPEVTDTHSNSFSPICMQGLLCCQPEPSLSHYLPDYHRLLHDSLADCKLKGDELSTWVSIAMPRCDREMHPQHKSVKLFAGRAFGYHLCLPFCKDALAPGFFHNPL